MSNEPRQPLTISTTASGKAAGRKFDLQERLVRFSVLVLEVVESLPDTRVGNHIAGQLLRSGTSPAPNYGEAQSAESRRDFLHKMRVCLKELRETEIHSLVIKEKQLIDPDEKLHKLLVECDELIAIFSKSISTAKRNASPR